MAKEQETPEVLEQENTEVQDTQEQANQEQQDGQPSRALAELTEKGSTMLTAKTREELFGLYDALNIEATGLTLLAGAVAQTDNGEYTLRIDATVKEEEK